MHKQTHTVQTRVVRGPSVFENSHALSYLMLTMTFQVDRGDIIVPTLLMRK